MIDAVIYTTPDDERRAYGFSIRNHGGGILCAAVSMLGLNTVNSLEVLTAVPLQYRYLPDGGHLECLLPGLLSGETQPDAAILLDALVLGLYAARDTYGSGRNGMRVTVRAGRADLFQDGNKQSDYTVFTR